MIEQLRAMEELVAACPDFGVSWDAHVAEWGNDVLYVAAGAFAEHLLTAYRTGKDAELCRAADALERLYARGSASVQEFATIGILEGVQNVWASAGVDPEIFGRHLGAEATKWWLGLNRFWSGSASVVRSAG